MDQGKIAFIASGGGMACAWSAGAAWALQEKGVRPHIFIGSSGSAGTVSYFACGQADRAAQLWIEEVSAPRVVTKRPLSIDVDFIIDSMKRRFPFDEARLRADSVDLFLATTDDQTLQPRFFSNHEKVDWYDVMRASMAIPFGYRRQVGIDGRSYFDGDMSATLAQCVALARTKGAETIYVCETSSGFFQSVFEIGLIPLLSREGIRAFRASVRQWMDRPNIDAANASIVYLRPRRSCSVIDNSSTAVKEAISAGYAEVEQLFGSSHA